MELFRYKEHNIAKSLGEKIGSWKPSNLGTKNKNGYILPSIYKAEVRNQM